MSIKTIVLADNSYTIRRIVELSFSEEKDIEVKSFENSLNLKEKLLELRPHIVMVDIKLPEFNGYQVCKFVQESESLQHTKVFLLKGGFEPIDENMLKNLRYVEIITKPFDSIALVSKVKKLMDEMPAPAQAFFAPPPPMNMEMEMPSSVPEDVPEIDSMAESDSDISFSDIKDEIDSDSFMGNDEFSGASAPYPYPDDEIMPNEEITQRQGAGPDRDNLAPHVTEDFENPFADEMNMEGGAFDTDSLTEEELNIKRNIEYQERELEIGSLTMEEMDIKQDIERRRRSNFAQQSMGLDDDLGIPDMGPEIGDDLGVDFGADMAGRPVPEFDEEELEEESEAVMRPMAQPDAADMFTDVNLDSIDSMIGRPTASSRPEVAKPEPSLWEDNPQKPELLDEDLFAPTPQKKSMAFESPDAFSVTEDRLFADEHEMPDINYETDMGHSGHVTLEDALPGFEEPQEEALPFTQSVPKKVQEERDPFAAFEPGKFDVDDLEMAEEADKAEAWDTYNDQVDEPLAISEEFSGFDELPEEEPIPAPRVPFVEPTKPVTVPVAPSMPVNKMPPVSPQPTPVARPASAAPTMSAPRPAAPQSVPPQVQVPRTSPVTPSAPSARPVSTPAPEQRVPQVTPQAPRPTPAPHTVPTIPTAPAPTVQAPKVAPVQPTQPIQPAPRPATPQPTAPSVQVPKTPPTAPVTPTPKAAPTPQPVMEPKAAPVPPAPAIPKAAPVPPVVEPLKTTPAAAPAPHIPQPTPTPAPAPKIPEPPATPSAPSATFPHEEILRKIEDKLTHAIKEMLWEIVPPLAEKIIKAEIAHLKAETEKAVK